MNELGIFHFPPAGLPQKAERGGYVYVIEYDSGLIKVGRTADPQTRVVTHASHAAAFGVRPVRGWLSPLHDDSGRTEGLLIEIATNGGGTPAGREYFNGADFDAVVSKARALPYTASVGTAELTVAAAEPRRPLGSWRFSPDEVETLVYMFAALDVFYGVPQDETSRLRHIAAAESALAVLDEGGFRRFYAEGPVIADRMPWLVQSPALEGDGMSNVIPIFGATVAPPEADHA